MNKSRIQDLQDPTKLFCLNINIEIFQKKGFMQDALPDYRLEITLGPMLPSRSFRPDTPRKKLQEYHQQGHVEPCAKTNSLFCCSKNKNIKYRVIGFSRLFHGFSIKILPIHPTKVARERAKLGRPQELRDLVRTASRNSWWRIPNKNMNFNQWPFQDPKLEVPTIYKAYIRPM